MKTVILTAVLGLAVGILCMYPFASNSSFQAYILAGLGGGFMGFMIGSVIAVTAARHLPKTDIIIDGGQLISAIPGKNEFGDYIISIVWKDKHGVIKTEAISPGEKLIKVAGRTPHVVAWEAAVSAGEPLVKKIKSVLKEKTGWAVDYDQECRFEVSMPETSLHKGYVFPLC
jgi:hypothetical protein